MNRIIFFQGKKIKFFYFILVMQVETSYTSIYVINSFTHLSQHFLSLMKPFLNLFLSIFS